MDTPKFGSKARLLRDCDSNCGRQLVEAVIRSRRKQPLGTDGSALRPSSRCFCDRLTESVAMTITHPRLLLHDLFVLLRFSGSWQ